MHHTSAYLDGLEPTRRQSLAELRNVILDTAPGEGKSRIRFRIPEDPPPGAATSMFWAIAVNTW